MNYTILLPLLFILQNVAIKGANDVAPLQGEFKFNIPVRPNMPRGVYPTLPNYNSELTQPSTGPNSVAVSRHHIIPINRLMQFYNKLVHESRASELSSFWKRLEEKISEFYPYNPTDALAFIKGLRLRTIVYNKNARPPNNFDDFQEYFTWLPGNLFIGPKKRSDDPGEEFEKDAKVIVGARFENLKNVNTLMKNYISNITVSFTELSDRLRDIANIMEPIKLRSSDWERNADGKYKIKV